ncbi:universal stress protein [Sphingomonas oleivorans]|uniref:universal stress protein n=1 Tax=Sphingomonas oleivorans TaxID=1735121 RepID=UPI0013FD737C|nr:universal stress protein [Sphingomonas oleivorans]
MATDLSARCDRALDRAMLLSRQLSGSLVAAHVVENRIVNANLSGDEEIRAAILDDFPELAGIERLVIAHGSVPSTIAGLADELHCDLIITGVARYNNLGDFIVGTAVDHLVRQARVPVLVVKRRARHDYQRLLVATDFSSCSRHALEEAAILFPTAPIRLVHAYHVPYESWLKSEGVREEIYAETEKELHDFLAGSNIGTLEGRLETRPVYGELETVVAQQLRETRSDLLVLGTHGKSGFAYATVGSHAADLLASMPCDILMIRETHR